MSGPGIATNGTLIMSPGNTPGEQVEMYCEDPMFLEYAARIHPEPMMEAVGNGFVSGVRDWGVGLNFLLSILGVYGSGAQEKCADWGDSLLNTVQWAINNIEIATKIVDLHFSHNFSAASAAGRFVGGGVISTLMATGGRFGRGMITKGRRMTPRRAKQIAHGSFGRSSLLRPRNWTNGAWKVNAPVATINFGVAGLGAGVVLARDNKLDVASLFLAILTGKNDGHSLDVYADLFRDAQNDPRALDPEETAHVMATLEMIEYCLENPGRALLGINAEQDSTHTIPVGRASSARPRGVRGLIQSGHETNALDAMAEDQAQ